MAAELNRWSFSASSTPEKVMRPGLSENRVDVSGDTRSRYGDRRHPRKIRRLLCPGDTVQPPRSERIQSLTVLVLVEFAGNEPFRAARRRRRRRDRTGVHPAGGRADGTAVIVRPS